MEETTQPRRVRVVGFGREVLLTQLLGLVGLLAVLATAISSGWIAAGIGVIAAAALLATIAQVIRLRRGGLTLWIEFDESLAQASPAEPAAADETPAEEDEPGEPAPPAGPHWTETPFPDPDEELYPEKVRAGRAERSDEADEEATAPHWSETTYPDPD
jgi:hypothetical protein